MRREKGRGEKELELHDPAWLVSGLRKKKRMSQTEFADLVGATQSQVSRWEAGSAKPSVDDWLRMATVAPHEDAEAYYVCASMEDGRVALISRATKTIVDYVRRFDPSRGANLEREIVGMTIDDRLDRAIQVMLEISPPTERVPPVVALSAEDRKLLDDTRKALDRFESQQGKSNARMQEESLGQEGRQGMATMSEFRERIGILRVKQDMSQADLGRYLGLGQGAVSMWETGENIPPAEALVKMGNLACYPDCLFFYEKAGMDMKRVTAVANVLKTCLDFIEDRVHLQQYKQLQRCVAGMNQEDQLNHVLDYIGGLGGLSPDSPGFLDEVVPAILQFVEQIDPAAAKELRPHVGGYGSAYDQMRYVGSTAGRILKLKKKKHPWERED